jgi:sugar phosphate isomerase/epimerase
LDEELIGVVYDAGNMVYEGYEQYQFGLELLGAHVHHVHIKDARQERLPEGGYAPRFCPIGEGQVRFDKLFAALKKQGYGGYLSFEDFSDKYEGDEKLTRNLDYIRALWG